jgi:hypothetical protein
MTDAAPDRLRAWRSAGRLLLVTFFSVVAALTLSGVHLVLVLVAGVAVAMAGSVLLDPRRSWWGPEPANTLSDPVRMSAYRKSEIRFLVATFVVLAIALPLVLGFLNALTRP